VTVYVIYVPKSATISNLDIGLTHGVWGWRDPVLERGDARAAAQSIRVGDLVLMGTGGSNPRVPPGGWDSTTLDRLIFLKAAKPLYRDTAPRWPDDVYPNRIGTTFLQEVRKPRPTDVGSGALEALRISANTLGAAVQVPHPSPFILAAASAGR
jgi:hypothetical protein